MKIINIIFLLLLAVLGCTRHPSGLFQNNQLNKLLVEFIHEADTAYSPHPYYQIILGNNSLGTKVDFIATNAYLRGPLYYFDPSSISLLGRYDINTTEVSVYASEGGSFDHILIERNKKTNIGEQQYPDKCKVESIIKRYQIYPDGKVAAVKLSEGTHPLVYFLSCDDDPTTWAVMILSENPQIYEIVSTELKVCGVWNKYESSKISLTPTALYRFSIARNEMVECPVESLSELMDLDAASIFSQVNYYRNGDGLVPCETGNVQPHTWRISHQ